MPDYPVNLANDPAITDKTQIKIDWQDGSSDGGATILDWRINYDQATGNYIVLETGVTQRSYTTTI